jgi:hypothetical protein
MEPINNRLQPCTFDIEAANQSSGSQRHTSDQRETIAGTIRTVNTASQAGLQVPALQAVTRAPEIGAQTTELFDAAHWAGNYGDTTVFCCLGLITGLITGLLFGAQSDSAGNPKHTTAADAAIGAAVGLGVTAIPSLWRTVFPCPWTNTMCMASSGGYGGGGYPNNSLNNSSLAANQQNAYQQNAMQQTAYSGWNAMNPGQSFANPYN